MMTPPRLSCPACGSSRTAHWQVKTVEAGNFPVRRCRACGSAFVWPRPAPDMIEAFYRGQGYKALSADDHQALQDTYYPDAAMDASRIIGRCRRLASGTRFLDIGAGFGEFSRAAREAGFEVMACEPNGNSRRIFARINGFEPIADMFDRGLAARLAGRFDVALASHLLEHVIDPEAFAANLGTVLAPGGIAAVAVPHFGSLLSLIQGKKDMFICPPEHLNFFTRRGLAALFERSGFRTIGGETVSKVNRATIRGAARGAFRGDWAWMGIYRGMRITDRLRLGMAINMYVRKPSVARPAEGESGE